MRVIDRGSLLGKELDSARAAGRTVGLVPTMGSLHRGHESLIRRSAAECDLTAVTVFVNPLQFGAGEDFATYPRDLDGDLAVAGAAGADLVFAPPLDDMQPDGPPATTVRAARCLAERLEGASRPGHLDGVVTVVARLFHLAGPCRAYFGEKDFQQLAVVRRMVADLAFPVEVVDCPTVREPDGLASSSRNACLSPAERRAAAVLWRALDGARRAVDEGERDAGRLRALLAGMVAAEPLALLDYAEVVDSATLEPVSGALAPDARMLVAAWIGSTRLIDNLGVIGP